MPRAPKKHPGAFGSFLFSELSHQPWFGLALDSAARESGKWSKHWRDILRDPVSLWFLADILQIFSAGNSSIPLNRYAGVPGYKSAVGDWDHFVTRNCTLPHAEEPYSSAAYRVLLLLVAFGLFRDFSVGFPMSAAAMRFPIVADCLRRFDGVSADPDELAREIVVCLDVFKPDDASDEKPFLLFDCHGGDLASDSWDTWPLVGIYGSRVRFEGEVDAKRVDAARAFLGEYARSLIKASDGMGGRVCSALARCKRFGNSAIVPLGACFSGQTPLLESLFALSFSGGSVVVPEWHPQDGNFSVVINDANLVAGMGPMAVPETPPRAEVSFDPKIGRFTVNGIAVGITALHRSILECVFEGGQGDPCDYSEIAAHFDGAYSGLDVDAQAKKRKAIKSAVEYLGKKVTEASGIKGIFVAGNSNVRFNPNIDVVVVKPA